MMDDGTRRQITESLAAIAQRDPGFDLNAFLGQAVEIYFLVERAREAGQPELARAKVGGGAWEQLGLDRAQGHPRQADPPELGEVEVREASSGAYDSITVRFPAHRGAKRSIEDWCFQRSATAVTRPPSQAAVCPGCGAPRTLTPAGACRYCGLPLSPVDASWTVTRVAEVSPDTAASAAAAVPEFAAAMAALLASPEAARAAAASRGQARPRSGCGCGLLFWLVAILALGSAGTALYGWLVPASSVHGPFASVIPGARRARITGRLQVTGGLQRNDPLAFWWPNTHKCFNLARTATAVTFTATRPDGTTLSLRIDGHGFPLATHGLGPHEDSIVLSYDRASPPAHQAWQPSATTTATGVLSGDGSGELTFAGLNPTLSDPAAPNGPLSGTVRWICKDQ
jgi:hypothetical protein